MANGSNLKGLRLLFVHSGSDLYGASRSLLRLSARFVVDGSKVTVIVPHAGPLVTELSDRGVNVLIQPDLAVVERNKIGSFWNLLDLLVSVFSSTYNIRKVISEFKPDLVHSMTSVVLSAGPAAALSGIPHIWHIRESFGEFGGLWKIYQFYLSLFSSKIICVSRPIADQFSSKMRERKITVIHNGFPRSEFEEVSGERIREFLEKYLIIDAKPLVGVVGRIKYRRKGQEIFVHAAGILRNRFPNARFLCIGSPFPGNEIHLEELLRLIDEQGLKGYVIYTGDIWDVKAAISSLDVLVLSSIEPEPFAGVVVEAMALKRPVVATSVGGSLEQVVDGSTGYLVEPGNSKSMAEAIGKLLESPSKAQEFGQNGQSRFLEKFEFEPFYRKILDLYDQVLKDS